VLSNAIVTVATPFASATVAVRPSPPEIFRVSTFVFPAVTVWLVPLSAETSNDLVALFATVLACETALLYAVSAAP
jgi:hypothetical protein